MVKVKNTSQLRNSTPFKSATFCSGIGSPEQSLKELDANHINVFACEKDKFARQTYLANFTPGVMLEDMTTESYDDPELYADLIVAGIPCQSFSLAGKRQGENDPRGLLIYDFIRYVRKRQPKVFIIENVKGLLSDAGGVTFSKWLDLLGCSKNGQSNMFTNPESLGYNLHYRVLNAKHYGLPQNRERVFIIGIRPDLPSEYKWPKRVVLKDRLIDLLESEVDEKYYLSLEQLEQLEQLDKRRKEKGNGFSFNYIDPEIENSSCITKSYCKLGGGDLIKVAQMPGFESRNRVYSDAGISPSLQSTVGGHKVPFVRLSGIKENDNSIRVVMSDGSGVQEIVYNKQNGISNALTKSHKPKVILENTRIRRYTPLECMRLMGYPDNFIKPCSETQTYKQAGNSIPVHMMKAVLRPLLPLLENPHTQIIPRSK